MKEIKLNQSVIPRFWKCKKRHPNLELFKGRLFNMQLDFWNQGLLSPKPLSTYEWIKGLKKTSRCTTLRWKEFSKKSFKEWNFSKRFSSRKIPLKSNRRSDNKRFHPLQIIEKLYFRILLTSERRCSKNIRRSKTKSGRKNRSKSNRQTRRKEGVSLNKFCREVSTYTDLQLRWHKSRRNTKLLKKIFILSIFLKRLTKPLKTSLNICKTRLSQQWCSLLKNNRSLLKTSKNRK